MRLLSRVLAGLGLTAALIVPAAASARSHHHIGSRPHHHIGFGQGGGDVYVNDNTASANTVAAFHRAPDGRLIPLPGSPVHTGGAGTGTALGSEGALQSAFGGRYLLAVDAGSDQVSVLAVGRDGIPRPVPGATVGSGGTQPVSIAVHGDLVYVANAGGAQPDYTGFRLGWDGRLHSIPGSTVDLPQGSQPGDVLFNATGTKLAGTRVGTSLIDSFAVDRSGRLHAAPGSPYAAQGLGPFGSEFRPTDPNELFVSNAHNVGPGTGTVSAFRVGFDGSLRSIGASPFADHQTAPCWVEISHDGRFLFAVNTAQPSISSFAINRDGSLTSLGATQFRGNPTGLGPVDARLAPDGRTLYVVDQGTDQVSGFAVHGGHLTELPSSPTTLPAGATPFGIVVS
jgi:6-phosphogluconolactonase